ncbi:MAG: glycosyltransferase family 9 protein [Deltaproteobacteria bacterium]|nr:glycosyltransferase family 9 protein [Deltaproteobacteria bacterium]
MNIRRQHTLPENIQNILIIQLGDIGDVVWSTPTLLAVKEAYPEARLSILLREGNGSLLEADPSIYKTYEVKKYTGSFLVKAIRQIGFIRELRQQRFDLVFDLRSDERGAFMAFITGAPIRASLYHQDVSPWRNFLFTHLVRPSQENVRTSFGAAEQSLRIARGFGIEAKTDVPKLWVSDETMHRAEKILESEGIIHPLAGPSDPWVTLNPFSRWPYKEWDIKKWAQIIDWLWKEYKIATVVVGAATEHERAGKIVQACSGKSYNLAGKTSLAELAGVLSLSRLHIGVDSAAPHIAAAVGTPTITLYGPSDWRDWAPVGDRHRVVVPDMDCVPCHEKGCDGLERSRCLENMSIDQVQAVIMQEIF